MGVLKKIQQKGLELFENYFKWSCRKYAQFTAAQLLKEILTGLHTTQNTLMIDVKPHYYSWHTSVHVLGSNTVGSIIRIFGFYPLLRDILNGRNFINLEGAALIVSLVTPGSSARLSDFNKVMAESHWLFKHGIELKTLEETLTSHGLFP